MDNAATLPLPALREDLKLHQGPEDYSGAPSWTIYDPARQRYFRIGRPAFELLSRWALGDGNKLIEDVNKSTLCRIDESDLDYLLRFLYSNELTLLPENEDLNEYFLKYKKEKSHWLLKLLKSYIFVRIPLVHPHDMLQKMLPVVEPLFSFSTRNFILFIGVIGLYLISRQWDTFINSFSYFFNLTGLFYYFIALAFIKFLHEMGHAFTATRYGCRVGTLGIAFMVFFPLLYTDTSDAWRVPSRRKRMLIGLAGVITELYIALVCTFLWNFLPDGVFRSIVFVMATTSWILTLFINTNPFLKFDGYYVLSDWWGIPNLQARAFQIGRWRLRKILFNIDEKAPEKLPDGIRRKMVAYAWLTWLYRLFLFTGIGLMVFKLFFKLLGIILLFVSLTRFIVIPLAKEIKVWWSMKDIIVKSRRTYVTLTVLAVVLLLFFVPWNTRVEIPAILDAEEKARIFSPNPAKIVEIKIREGDVIYKDDILFILASPALEEEIIKTRRELDLVRLRLNRRVANPDDLADLQVILQQEKEKHTKLSGLLKRQEQLVVRSPIDGIVYDISDGLHAEQWINNKTELAFIAIPKMKIEGLIPETELSRVHNLYKSIFIPDDPMREKINATIEDVELANLKNIDIPYLVSEYGGDIPVRQDEDGNIVPVASTYRVRLIITDEIDIHNPQVIKGVLHIQGQPRSMAKRAYELIVSVFIRESGF